MPKLYTFPTLFDNALQISISKLKEWNYLEPGQIKNGSITWSRNGIQTDWISIRANTFVDEQPYIELNYNYRDKPRKYKVMLVSIPSNLGKGDVWYFLCPQTKKRCRKLYSIGGYFLHRDAFNGCMYDSQTKSKKYRALDKAFGDYFKIDTLFEELYKKNFKKTYAGKPTKKYLKLTQQIKNAESMSVDEFEQLMITR
ncbi:MAG: hypothetical protein P4L28_00285 [Paludibacteraceae bacterium]|nr:hypothetical protein [Paludibacteraceae bacterium]